MLIVGDTDGINDGLDDDLGTNDGIVVGCIMYEGEYDGKSDGSEYLVGLYVSDGFCDGYKVGFNDIVGISQELGCTVGKT